MASKPPADPASTAYGSTPNGDKVKLETHFGPVQTPSESNVNQEVLGNCQGADGRELVVEVRYTVTLESNLSAEVVVGGLIPSIMQVSRLVDLVLDYSEGQTCETLTAESKVAFNLGKLQPHEPHSCVLWVVLPDAVTPKNPHPSYQDLAKQNWVIGGVEVGVDNSRVQFGLSHGPKGIEVIH